MLLFFIHHKKITSNLAVLSYNSVKRCVTNRFKYDRLRSTRRQPCGKPGVFFAKALFLGLMPLPFYSPLVALFTASFSAWRLCIYFIFAHSILKIP